MPRCRTRRVRWNILPPKRKTSALVQPLEVGRRAELRNLSLSPIELGPRSRTEQPQTLSRADAAGCLEVMPMDMLSACIWQTGAGVLSGSVMA